MVYKRSLGIQSPMKGITPSYSMDLREQSPFRSREVRVDQMPQMPVYTNWFMDLFLNKEIKPYEARNNEPRQIVPSGKYYITFHRNKIQKVSADTDDNERIFFWYNVESLTNESIKVLNEVIKEQFSSVVNINSVFPFIDTSLEQIVSAANIPRFKNTYRTIFHYVGYSMPNQNLENLLFGTIERPEEVPFKNIIDSFGNNSILIIDRDSSGILLNTLIHHIETKRTPTDIIAFFSCSESQKMHASSNFPSDIFTACLTTPARIALTFHSRNYFCFGDSPLRPISAYIFNFSNEEEKDRINKIVSEVTFIIQATVEAIAFKKLKPSLFTKLFRSDKSLATLAANYFLSCRILGSFDVTPVSYPTLPNLMDEPEWHTLDLRLDAALFQLNTPKPNPQLSFNSFLCQILCSMEYSLATTVESAEIPFEMTLLPLVLSVDSLCIRACNVLASFLDSSKAGVDWCVQFGIAEALFGVLKRNIVAPSILFSLIKILAIHPEIRSDIMDRHGAVVENVLCPIIIRATPLKGEPEIQTSDSEASLDKRTLSDGLLSTDIHTDPLRGVPTIDASLSLILLVLLMHDSAPYFRKAFKSRNIYERLSLSYSPAWSLLLISAIVPNIADVEMLNRMLDKAIYTEIGDSIELQVCVINALSSFIQDGNAFMKRNTSSFDMKKRRQIEKKAVSKALEFQDCLSHLVRREILVLLSKFIAGRSSKFLESQEEFYNKMKLFFAKCIADPFPEISSLAHQIDSALHNDGDPIIPSSVLSTYIGSLSSPCLYLMEGTSPYEPHSPKPPSPALPRSRSSLTRMTSTRPTDLRKMKLGPIAKHPHKITSNIIIESQRYIYGDAMGCLCARKIGDTSDQYTSNSVTERAVSCIRTIKNSGDPLLLSAGMNGALTVRKYSESYLPHVEAFVLNDVFSTVDDNYQIEVCQITNHLYSWVPGVSKVFDVRDLVTSSLIDSLKAPDGHANCLKPLARFCDYVAVAGSSFSIIDLRDSNKPALSVELDAPVKFFEPIDDLIPSFAVCSESTSVGLFDTRYPSGLRTVKVWLNDGVDDSTLSFSVSQDTSVAALGHSAGITCVNLINGQQAPVPNIPVSFKATRVAKPSVISILKKQLIFVNEMKELVHVNI